MPPRALLPIVATTILVFGCNPFSQAQASCDAIAPEWSGVAVGAFDITLGRARGLQPFVSSSDHWPGQPDNAPAIACYVDGFIPKAPPDGEPFDRAIVVIYQGRAELVVAGYRDSLPVGNP